MSVRDQEHPRRVQSDRKRERADPHVSPATSWLTGFTRLRRSSPAENQRLVESLTDELTRLAERVTELEDRARRPWWRRALDPIAEEREPAARARKRAVARLRALYPDRATRELRPI
jgi:hypothetical protein